MYWNAKKIIRKNQTIFDGLNAERRVNMIYCNVIRDFLLFVHFFFNLRGHDMTYNIMYPLSTHLRAHKWRSTALEFTSIYKRCDDIHAIRHYRIRMQRKNINYIASSRSVRPVIIIPPKPFSRCLHNIAYYIWVCGFPGRGRGGERTVPWHDHIHYSASIP